MSCTMIDWHMDIAFVSTCRRCRVQGEGGRKAAERIGMVQKLTELYRIQWNLAESYLLPGRRDLYSLQKVEECCGIPQNSPDKLRLDQAALWKEGEYAGK